MRHMRDTRNTDQPYVVCKGCWDKIKNVKTGARVWVHAELERQSPGTIDMFRARIRRDGIHSDAFHAFEQLFHAQLDRCARTGLHALVLISRRYRCPQVQARGAGPAAAQGHDTRGAVRPQVRTGRARKTESRRPRVMRSPSALLWCCVWECEVLVGWRGNPAEHLWRCRITDHNSSAFLDLRCAHAFWNEIAPYCVNTSR